MDPWPKLFKKFHVAESERSARERQAEEKRSAFDRWCLESTDAALEAVVEGAQRRGAEFTQNTGIPVVVEAPNRTPVGSGDGGPRRIFIRVTLGFARVDLYSHQEFGALPMLHIVRSQHSPSESPLGRRVIVSLPTCIVSPSEDGGWVLCRPASGKTDNQGVTLEVDELVYQIFEILVDVHTKVTMTHEV